MEGEISGKFAEILSEEDDYRNLERNEPQKTPFMEEKAYQRRVTVRNEVTFFISAIKKAINEEIRGTSFPSVASLKFKSKDLSSQGRRPFN